MKTWFNNLDSQKHKSFADQRNEILSVFTITLTKLKDLTNQMNVSHAANSAKISELMKTNQEIENLLESNNSTIEKINNILS